AITSYKIRNKQIINEGPLVNFWRAPTDNDYGAGLQNRLLEWKEASSNAQNTSIKFTPQDAQGWAKITIEKILLNGDASFTQIIQIDGNGALEIKNTFTAIKGNHPMLFRFGNHFTLSNDFSQIAWYGKGPFENYQDRNSASLTGTYQASLKDSYYPYIRPQESGNKTNVRWAKISKLDGTGFTVAFQNELLNINFLPYSLDQLSSGPQKQQEHSGELTNDKNVHLDIDLAQMGLGSINSWGALPLEKYRLPFKNYEYSYIIIPDKK
ncbi:MAG: beta-galactosidase small subunit, partial [Saprospiraceae bacterium]